MKKIKKNFENEKIEVIKKLKDFYFAYENLTNQVKQQNWKTTGEHFTQLRQINNDVKNLKEATKEQIFEISDWVNDKLNNKTSWKD